MGEVPSECEAERVCEATEAAQHRTHHIHTLKKQDVIFISHDENGVPFFILPDFLSPAQACGTFLFKILLKKIILTE